jgi:hypothetical protein
VGEVGLLLCLRREAAPALCATNRVPVSFELTAANVAAVLLVEEVLGVAGLGAGTVRKLFGDLAYRSGALAETLAKRGVLLVSERAVSAGRRFASRWRCVWRLSRAFSGWRARWPRRWLGWPLG